MNFYVEYCPLPEAHMINKTFWQLGLLLSSGDQ